MVAETVVNDILTDAMTEAGAELTRLLDQAGLEVRASLWLYMPDGNVWRLVIASPEVETLGPKKVYEKIQSVLSQRPEKRPRLGLKDISVVEPAHPLVSLLAKAISTGDDVSGIRFSRNVIDGQFIEDAYIYRML